MTQRLELPWPDKALSPNARVHWAQKAKAAKQYRNWAYLACRNAGIKADKAQGKIHLFIDFYPPDKRPRDDDNLIASFKSARDGIADALGVDDKHFVCHPFLQAEIVPGGIVKVKISDIQNTLRTV